MRQNQIQAKNPITVQSIVEKIRRHETSTGQKWCGTKKMYDTAVCRYPNLAAEILARRHFLWYPAEVMNITTEVLADILENGEDLYSSEAISICDHWNLSPDYLFSDTIFTVNVEGECITCAQYSKNIRDLEKSEIKPLPTPRARKEHLS